MAQSIRVSDELYALALQEARLMDRSLAQQLEHWAKVGRALERSGIASLDDLRAAAIAHRRSIDELDVIRGHRSAASLLVIPEGLAKRVELTVPADAFQDSPSW
jgi:hypothetical protein